MKTFILTAFFGPALLLAGCSAKDCDETNNRSFTGESADHSNDEMHSNAMQEHNEMRNDAMQDYNHPDKGTGEKTSNNIGKTTIYKYGHTYHTDAHTGKKNAIGNHSTVTNNHLTHRDLMKKNLDSTGNYSDLGPTYNNQNGH